jgi:beta-mannosidase
MAPPSALPDSARWDELEKVTEWLPASVPGNVRADLLRAGRLPGLSFGLEAEAAQWVDDHCWWLVRDFPGPIAPQERAHLILEGVDYISDLFLNSQHLGRHEGMFSPQVYDVTSKLKEQNRLAVRLLGSKWLPSDRSTPWEKLLNIVEAKVNNLPGRFPHRRDTLKCQMGFGWDFAPVLRTAGIWDEAYVAVSGAVFVQDVAVRQALNNDTARIMVRTTLDAPRDCAVQLRLTLAGETFESKPFLVQEALSLPPGTSQHTLDVSLQQPRLWWPWDHGRPDLYRLALEVWDQGTLLDRRVLAVGLRDLRLDGHVFYVNDRRVFARGANWVPADILPGRVGSQDYDALLTRARQANMNLLRVWGGGLREKRPFYDFCDRQGVLIWQEFPLACTFLTRFPRSGEYLSLVEGEATAIIRHLRNHPSLALWCGGNEFSPRRNAPLVAVLRRAVEREDPDRPFLPASPVDGDRHNWQVWHDYHPPSAYRHDQAAFASEFGLQAPPDMETLHTFIPAAELWPPGPSWVYHNADLKKLKRYAAPFLKGEAPSLAAFVQASQRAQAQALQIAIEHYRRRKAQNCGGVLVWQLNEPWSAISWALLDFYRQPKPAYHTVKRLLGPLLVSLDYPLQRYHPGDSFRGDVWILNDTAEQLPGCGLEVILCDGNGVGLRHLAHTVDVAADSATVVTSLDWKLPEANEWHIRCRLYRSNQTLATNEYDLAIHDDLEPTWAQRLRAWLARLAIEK